MKKKGGIAGGGDEARGAKEATDAAAQQVPRRPASEAAVPKSEGAGDEVGDGGNDVDEGKGGGDALEGQSVVEDAPEIAPRSEGDDLEALAASIGGEEGREGEGGPETEALEGGNSMEQARSSSPDNFDAGGGRAEEEAAGERPAQVEIEAGSLVEVWGAEEREDRQVAGAEVDPKRRLRSRTVGDDGGGGEEEEGGAGDVSSCHSLSSEEERELVRQQEQEIARRALDDAGQ